jgi:phosphatidylserine decarboxylase
LRLTIYGRSTIIKVLVITLLIDIIALAVPFLLLKLILLIISILIFVFTLFFFRDPVRQLPDDVKENDIVSPADGKVLLIEEIDENIFLKSRAKLIGIFLSPLNVHINRIPASGKVEYFNYIKGDYVVAFNEKSSERNERTVIGVSSNNYRLLFKQIAGFVARRIICSIRQGDNIRKGEKFGMIKFGSRMDVIVPEGSLIKVSVNQKVKGGLTVIAEVNTV